MGTGVIIHPRSDPKFNDSEEELKPVTDFAVKWDNWYDNTKDYTLKRVGDSSDFMFSPKTDSYPGISTFDDYYPWKGIRLCNLSTDGKVTAYYGTPEFTFEPSDGNVMVEIPKFWYAIEAATEADESGNRPMIFHISNEEKEGYFVSPRHQKFGDRTTDFEKIYISAYPCQPDLRSVSGRQPIQNMVAYDIQKYIIDNDIKNYYQIDIFTILTLELLRIIETKSFFISSIANITSYDFANTQIYAGETNQLGFHTGQLTENTSWRYRYIENLLDNYYYTGTPTMSALDITGIYSWDGAYAGTWQNILLVSNNPHGITDIDAIMNGTIPVDYVFQNRQGCREKSTLSMGAAITGNSTYYDWNVFMPGHGGYKGIPIKTACHEIIAQYSNYPIGLSCPFAMGAGLLSYNKSTNVSMSASQLSYYYPNLHTRFIYLPPEE